MVADAMAWIEETRTQGVTALFKRSERVDRERAETLIDGCWLHCRDLVLARAGAPPALLTDPARAEALAAEEDAREYRGQRHREEAAIVTSGKLARSRGLAMKVVDVEMPTGQRRVTVYFSSEERVDFRDLVRDLAREFRARIEMRQIGARDTTRVLDGIGPCGRQLCCSSHLRKF